MGIDPGIGIPPGGRKGMPLGGPGNGGIPFGPGGKGGWKGIPPGGIIPPGGGIIPGGGNGIPRPAGLAIT